MSWTEVFLVWLAGVMNGFIITSFLVMHIGRKALSKTRDTASPRKPEITDDEIRGRIRAVKELTDLQIALQVSTDGPQKNAMDGKYKNQINKQIKDLEEQKVELLKSIIDDGFDPVISVANTDGTIENLSLSAFMAQKNIVMQPKSGDANDKISERKKALSKFTVHTGGKPDGGTTH